MLKTDFTACPTIPWHHIVKHVYDETNETFQIRSELIKDPNPHVLTDTIDILVTTSGKENNHIVETSSNFNNKTINTNTDEIYKRSNLFLTF